MVKKDILKVPWKFITAQPIKYRIQKFRQKFKKNISDIHAYLKSSDPNSKRHFRKYSDNREKEFTESLKELYRKSF